MEFINDYINDLLFEYGVDENWIHSISWLVAIVLLVVVCILAQKITKKIVLKILNTLYKKKQFKWGTILIESKVFQRATLWLPAIIVSSCAPIFNEYEYLVIRVTTAYAYFVIMLVTNSVITMIDDIYKTKEVSKIRPIKSLLQVIQIVIYILIGIAIFATLIGKDTLVILSSIGALTAVFSLVFKDSILGFVAGIQLTSNDMLRIGDWIEMPKYNADGIVSELTLNTVKVQNANKTIVTIPAYALVSDSFINWRGIWQAGARHIKRSIYIDTTSICFCSDEMIEKFRKIKFLSDYIDQKTEEIEKYNATLSPDNAMFVNGRHLTNVGTFRAYLENYLKNHPGIQPGMTQMVRQLAPDEKGLPLQIYAYSNSPVWAEYEKVQADIFDHIFAIAGEFGLRVFQSPSGYDLRKNS